MTTRLGWVAAALALGACGMPLIGGECAEGYAQVGVQCVPAPDAAVTGDAPPVARSCARNTDCDTDEICLDSRCTLAGQCIVDAHCSCLAPTCVDHACVGASACRDGGDDAPPERCAITADCPPHFYCINGLCEFATECVRHADCPVNEACFRAVCWSY